MSWQVNKDLNELVYSANNAAHVAINILYLVAEHMKNLAIEYGFPVVEVVQ
jgi:hypothetical protein